MKVTINRVETKCNSYYWIMQYMASPNAIYDVNEVTSKVVDIDEEYLMSWDLEELAYKSYYGEHHESLYISFNVNWSWMGKC